MSVSNRSISPECCAATSSASTPSTAWSTRYPVRCRNSATKASTSGVSSATRIVRPDFSTHGGEADRFRILKDIRTPASFQPGGLAALSGQGHPDCPAQGDASRLSEERDADPRAHRGAQDRSQENGSL